MSLIYKDQILADVGSSGGTSEEVYSTEETRIGTWIDGKPLYRRAKEGVINVSVGAMEPIIFDEDVFPIRIDAVAVGVNGYVCSLSSSPRVVTDDTDLAETCYVFYYKPTKRVILINKTGEFLNQPYRIVIEYTKTTDEAAS